MNYIVILYFFKYNKSFNLSINKSPIFKGFSPDFGFGNPYLQVRFYFYRYY